MPSCSSKELIFVIPVSFPAQHFLTTLPLQHKPGVQASPADHAEVFSAKTLPAGSAPADRTFAPNTQTEIPGQADNDATFRSHGKESTYTSANDTLGGTTSGAVHTGLGHPGQGQTSTELRHDGTHTATREGNGLQGLSQGGSGLTDDGNVEARQQPEILPIMDLVMPASTTLRMRVPRTNYQLLQKSSAACVIEDAGNDGRDGDVTFADHH